MCEQCFPFLLGCNLEGCPILAMELCSFDESGKNVLTVYKAIYKSNSRSSFGEHQWFIVFVFVKVVKELFTYMRSMLLFIMTSSQTVVLTKQGNNIQ